MANMVLINGRVYQSGMPVTARYTDDTVITGHLHLHLRSRNLQDAGPEDYTFFLCHDSSKKCGASSPCKWGHRFSWVFKYLPAVGRFTDDIAEITPGIGTKLITKPNVAISSELDRFAQFVSGTVDLITMFHIECKPFEALNKYELSDKAGFIRISGEVKTMNGTFPKSVEIKLARFVKGVSNHLSRSGVDLVSDDATVEKVHNSLVSFQTGSMFRLEMLSGEDILKGYDSENYPKRPIGTLHKSCMNDKGDYMGIYTCNPCVRLAVLRSDDGIEARCLVWTTEDGKTVHDRIYYTHEWIQNVMAEKMAVLGHTSAAEIIESAGVCSVKLEHYKFAEYPYLDTFRFLSMQDGRAYGAPHVHSLPNGRYLLLATAHGAAVPVANND